MYYLNPQKFGKARLPLTTFLIFTLSQIIFQSDTSAQMFQQEAENYHTNGYDLQRKGNYKQALVAYSKALELGLETADFYNDLGVLYEQLGAPDKAEDSYLHAIAVDPIYLPPYTNLAYFYAGKGDTEKATYYFQERLNRASPDDPWRERLGREIYKLNPQLKEQIRKQEAARKAEEARQALIKKTREEFSLQITRSTRHFQQGQQWLQEKKFNEAVECFDRALAITPGNPKILQARNEAIYSRDIEDIRMRTQQATQKLDAGDLESAKKEFQNILAIIPSEPIQKSK